MNALETANEMKITGKCGKCIKNIVFDYNKSKKNIKNSGRYYGNNKMTATLLPHIAIHTLESISMVHLCVSVHFHFAQSEMYKQYNFFCNGCFVVCENRFN